MKRLISLVLTLALGIFAASAQNYAQSNRLKSDNLTSSYGVSTSSQWVNGYTRKDGTQVQGHYRSKPDKTNTNNWSTVGNSNPYTGSYGTVARDYAPSAYNYSSGQTVHTGPRGGQYYINSNGNKTYVPKR